MGKSFRKEAYQMIRERLRGLEAIRHVDLWNHNVEFVEQEESWARPAVFVEFAPIQWSAIVDGLEYRSEPEVRLHVVTDWAGGADGDDAALEASLGVFDLLEDIHLALACAKGETFLGFDLAASQTNHNHEELVKNIEIYQCVARKKL